MGRLPAIALIAALLSSCGEDKPAPKVSGGGIPWITTLDEALSRARSSGKPVLLHFYTPEWTICQRVGAETFPDAKVKEAAAKFEPVRIDFETNQALCEKYGVRAMPDFRILKPDGTEVHQIKRGFLTPDELARELESGLAKAK